MKVRMHEYVTCKFKNIMGLAQSKPISTHHYNKINTHLKCMIHCYNVDVMQSMMFQNSFMQNPTQNFCKNLINFEKTKFFFKKNPKS